MLKTVNNFQKLKPTENEIIGKWIILNGKVTKDIVCKRIEGLTSSYLKKIAVSATYGAWETLFLDKNDGRYWEQTFPKGDMQGGGPPTLKVLSRNEAEVKYYLRLP